MNSVAKQDNLADEEEKKHFGLGFASVNPFPGVRFSIGRLYTELNNLSVQDIRNTVAAAGFAVTKMRPKQKLFPAWEAGSKSCLR